MQSGARAILAGAAVAAVAAAAASGTAAGGRKKQIAIHEHGTTPTGDAGAITGRFALDVAATPFGPGGTTRISTDPASTTFLRGQTRVAFSGIDTLTGKNGRIEIAFSGTHIPINTHLVSGRAIAPAVETGTWKIKTATGDYQGWTGSGVWAAAIWGYGARQQYAVEWDGSLTR
jgi:ABC-type branched-subunit amino acid transport system substrate-binding protein